MKRVNSASVFGSQNDIGMFREVAKSMSTKYHSLASAQSFEPFEQILKISESVAQ